MSAKWRAPAEYAGPVLVPANGRLRTDGGGAWPRTGDQPAPTVTGEVGSQWQWVDVADLERRASQ